MPEPYDDHDSLPDVRLTSSAPPTSEIDAADEIELLAMVRSARVAARPTRLGRVPRGAVAGLAAAIVLGGVGAAAALTGHVWTGWAAEPDAVVTFELPSGASCEDRVGNFQSNDPEVDAALADYVASVDLMELIDVEAAIRESRQGEHVFVDEQGNEVPAGYGTEHYDADQEYYSAVGMEIGKLIHAELTRLGYSEGEITALDLSHDGQGYCPGAW